MSERLRVDSGSGAYDIHIGERLLLKAGEVIAPFAKNKQAIIISDEHVARPYLHRLTSALEGHAIRTRCVQIAPGEASKSYEAFGRLLDQLLEQNPTRSTLLIALGGGVVGDVTGFAASVLLRGLDFVQIPTTLLAQIDSSVGGKTGINARQGKNLIGSFHAPRAVIADLSLLASLPKRELLAGYAEMLKYGLINDAAFFDWLEAEAAQFLFAPNDARMARAVAQCCRAKAAIVAADEKEKSGLRALLNLGHTFAHALEAETGYGEALLHGEAVAIGMVLALELSAALGQCDAALAARLSAHLRAVGLPASPRDIRPEWNIDALLGHMAHDKKNTADGLTFILLRGIGAAYVANSVDKSTVRQVLARAVGSL